LRAERGVIQLPILFSALAASLQSMFKRREIHLVNVFKRQQKNSRKLFVLGSFVRQTKFYRTKWFELLTGAAGR